jgi:hypothetical protein
MARCLAMSYQYSPYETHSEPLGVCLHCFGWRRRVGTRSKTACTFLEIARKLPILLFGSIISGVRRVAGQPAEPRSFFWRCRSASAARGRTRGMEQPEGMCAAALSIYLAGMGHQRTKNRARHPEFRINGFPISMCMRSMYIS